MPTFLCTDFTFKDLFKQICGQCFASATTKCTGRLENATCIYCVGGPVLVTSHCALILCVTSDRLRHVILQLIDVHDDCVAGAVPGDQ